MVGDRELLGLREDYYGLLVSLLWREPDAGLVRGLGLGLGERIAALREEVPELVEGWRRIEAFLADTPAEQAGEAAREEYTRLFIGPPHPELNLYESFYLTGHVLDRPLAVLRGELARLGIVKDGGYAEPEDFLAFELDVMRRLIRRQAEAADHEEEARWLRAQAAFLKGHLLVWAPAAARDLARAGGAPFYRAVGSLLEGFLAFERRLMEGWDPAPVATLEEARQRYAGTGAWRGPLLDAGAGAGPGGLGEGGS